MYRCGLPPAMMSGRYFSASSSHVVTCARMSFTDQSPVTPDSVSRESGKPAYDSLNAFQAVSSRLRSCCLSMAHGPLLKSPEYVPVNAAVLVICRASSCGCHSAVDSVFLIQDTHITRRGLKEL